MRIGVIGSGYVGLVTGTCLADAGNHVTCADVDARKVAALSAGECPIYEPGLEELLDKNLKAGRLSFTADLSEAVAGANVVFIAVGTPPDANGAADLRNVERVAAEIAAELTGPAIIVVKSTVPVGTCARLRGIIAEHTDIPFSVVSNPEFLKEGTAVDDFQRPDRVVIGADDEPAYEVVAELYRPFVLNNRPVLRMTPAAAEMSKYAANAFLATRISFINEMADLCERLDVDINEVRRAIGSDARIGHHFLYPGVGYGGSCFPKDVQALIHVGRGAGGSCNILQAVHDRNLLQRRRMADRVRERLGGDLTGRRIAIWGLAFKPKTDDIREAPAVDIIESLLESGASVAVHDPVALPNARRHFGHRVEYAEDAYEALRGADVLLIATEWNEFRSPDFDLIRARLKQPLIFDGRNIFPSSAMRRHGFEYHSIGRPVVRPGGD